MTSETPCSQASSTTENNSNKRANAKREDNNNEKSAGKCESTLLPSLLQNEFSDSGLEEVRKVAEKLKLNPRRPSIAKWMAENQNGGFRNRTKRLFAAATDKDPASSAAIINSAAAVEAVQDEEIKFASVEEAIHWIKNELIQMRDLDHRLARQLIGLRTEINRLKLHKSCTEHQALLDDVTLELEERDEISDLCDTPFGQFTSPLRGIGITRMNLNARRFSLS